MAGFIVPFMFVYEPALLLIGPWYVSALAFASAIIGVIALASSLHGYLFAPLTMWQRPVLFVAALLLIAPELVSSLVGIVLLTVIALQQKLAGRPRRVAARQRAK